MRRRTGTSDRERGYRVVPYPQAQRQIVDWLELARRRHTIHALLELDVTDSRRAIRAARSRTGEPLSLSALLVACLARAIEADPQMQASPGGRRGLVLFDDVDVTVAVEHDLEGEMIPVPHIVRAANRKEAAIITRELRAVKAGDAPYAAARRLLPLWLLFPGFLRRALWRILLADPRRRRRLTGTTFLTAVGGFGSGAAWGVPQGHNYPLGVTMGGIARKPGVGRTPEGERIEVRELLCLTLSLDHDLIDGAPAARFAAKLKELGEGGAGILDGQPPAG